ncbi:unnamed protein product [Symbiodinium microadriaticum]|nr:unnamed protein product [Symbiodinium microadriaticum]
MFSYFEQWKMGKQMPFLKQIGKSAMLDFLNNLNDEHISILEEYFGERVVVERLDYSVATSIEVTMSEKMNGVIMFYLNYSPDIEGVSLREHVDIFKELNAEFIKQLESETYYRVVIVPTTNEASRVEKMDFDHPFPRFMPNSVDIQETEQNKKFIREIMEKKFVHKKEDK